LSIVNTKIIQDFIQIFYKTPPGFVGSGGREWVGAAEGVGGYIKNTEGGVSLVTTLKNKKKIFA